MKKPWIRVTGMFEDKENHYLFGPMETMTFILKKTGKKAPPYILYIRDGGTKSTKKRRVIEEDDEEDYTP